MEENWNACMQTLEGHSNLVDSVTFSYHSKLLASASWDKTVKVWDASSGQCVQTLEGHSDWVCSVAFSHDSKLLASASWDKTVKVWDASSGQCLHTILVNQFVTIKSFGAPAGCIHLNIGTVHFCSDSNTPPTNIDPPELPQFKGLSVGPDQTWITWNSENLLWLPPDYRPTTSFVLLSTLTLGCDSGRVLLFNFDSDKLSFLFP